MGYDSTNKDFIVAAHTFNTKTAHLSDYSPSGGFIIYNMRWKAWTYISYCEILISKMKKLYGIIIFYHTNLYESGKSEGNSENAVAL